ncbi:glycosyltransferase family 39 protein [Jatrophihabitans sp. DSM 44399]|uniref:Glycosyltransferase family 39 protein n=1 Tax=Jatrophihabitans lederbergiae TaxID=3075547 RepID=A0ABU2JAZ3_9ACTN|nr:glycosyltransferase family 39 protein [Jatrophihabitans sp. DSM 44399]MDT0262155.1 glycosyltransferase family 39 protein [Jatrophihabitans sp. DSM 44399]
MSTETLVPPGRSLSPSAPRIERGNRVRALIRGRVDDPAWVRPSVLGLLLATALLYLWGLGASGYANSFYSAAAQAGSASWKAMFFGSSDAANSITVDKPPGALWIMALSVRIFGLNSWSILVPQALEGVAAVGMLYLAVRRTSGAAAGILAGAVLAVTPVAALMFRFNNPDSLLLLLMIAGGYGVIRALETASTKWLILVGVLTGFGFLTKMLQALLVVPAFALVYLFAARRTRLGDASCSCLPPVVRWWSRPAGGSRSSR